MPIIDILKKITDSNLNDFWKLSMEIISFINESEKEEQLDIFTVFLRDIDISEYTLPEYDDHFNLSDEHYKRFLDVSRTSERIIQNLLNTNVTEKIFYEKLWNKFNDQDLFPSSEDKYALLLSLWLDVRIPYYQLGESCSMEDDEYEKTMRLLTPELKKAKFIIHSGLQQKTQRTSLLMALADTIPDIRKKTVFWSVVITFISEREAQLQSDHISEDMSSEEKEE